MSTFTTEQLANLESAYAQGVLTVRDGDKMVTYASAGDMWLAILRIRRGLRSPVSRYPANIVRFRSPH